MFRNAQNWIGSYLRQRLSRLGRPAAARPIHVVFAVCDHFEPEWRHAAPGTQARRVDAWLDRLPALAERHRDGNGCHVRHTFFYPIEAYHEAHLEKLAQICQRGFGEVEIHLHHDGDTESSLRAKLELGKMQLDAHGFLGRYRDSDRIAFAFIHGNWALNNSCPEGRWCGVNNELCVLKRAGCYADFTFPSAPDRTQPRKINRLYYGESSRDYPQAHQQGTDVRVGSANPEKLMLIQGPLTLDWRRRVKGIFPRIENGDITGKNPPIPRRVDLWVRQRISVVGRGDWVFVKVHTHGAQEENLETLLGAPMEQMYSHLEATYNDGEAYVLHYVSAREMYNIVKAAEAGERGDPHLYRDYLVRPPRAFGTRPDVRIDRPLILSKSAHRETVEGCASRDANG